MIQGTLARVPSEVGWGQGTLANVPWGMGRGGGASGGNLPNQPRVYSGHLPAQCRLKLEQSCDLPLSSDRLFPDKICFLPKALKCMGLHWLRALTPTLRRDFLVRSARHPRPGIVV